MKKLVLISLFLSVHILTFCQSDFKILYGPYLQSMTEDEATIVWVTNKDAVSWVEVAPDDQTHFYAEERPQYFQTHFGKKVIGTLHAIRLTNLQKSTSYRYRIYSKEVMEQTPYYIQYGKVTASNVYKQKPYKFKTLDTTEKEISFAVVNDIHGDNELFSSLMREQEKEHLDFVLFNGDMLSNMSSEQQLFDGFLTQAVNMFASEIPFFYARGNHETRGLFSTEYIRYFPTPTGQPYYSFRQGPAFFIVLDGGEDKPDNDIEYHGLAAFDKYREDEIKWLKETVNSEAFKQAPIEIAIMHVPPIRSTWHGPIQVKEHFIPILNEAGIKLMLCAHLHNHQYIPTGQEGCNFPILINSNTHVTTIKINDTAIDICIKDETGKTVKAIKL